MGRPRLVKYDVPRICQRVRKVTNFLRDEPEAQPDPLMVSEYPFRFETYSAGGVPVYGLAMNFHYNKLNLTTLRNRNLLGTSVSNMSGMWVGPAGIKTVLNNTQNRLSVSLKR